MALLIPYRGVIEIVGDHDVGKTIAALQTTSSMKNVVFVDDDVKGEGTVKQMKESGIEFADYIDLAAMRLKLGDTPTGDELLQHIVIPTIEKLTEKHREVIIWDTWRIVYQAARSHVERNQHRYNDVVTFRGSSQIIQGLISKVARMIERNQLSKLKASCDLLVITHHVKDHYINNVVIGKIPESSSTFDEVCNMRMWLRRNTQSKVPVILFLKRPNLPKMTKQGPRFINIVPLKITPTDKHESIWEAIAEYQERPIESRMPRADETPTAEELAAISGTMTKEQQTYVRTMVEYQLKMEKDLTETLQSMAEERDEQTHTESRKNAPGPSGELLENSQNGNPPANGVQMLSRAKVELNLEPSQVAELLGDSLPSVISRYTPADWETLKNKAGQKSAQKEVKKKAKK